jgi:hypothetical protein
MALAESIYAPFRIEKHIKIKLDLIGLRFWDESPTEEDLDIYNASDTEIKDGETPAQALHNYAQAHDPRQVKIWTNVLLWQHKITRAEALHCMHDTFFYYALRLQEQAGDNSSLINGAYLMTESYASLLDGTHSVDNIHNLALEDALGTEETEPLAPNSVLARHGRDGNVIRVTIK